MTIENREDDLGHLFVALADALLGVPADDGVVGVVERVVFASTAIVPGADIVSVSLRGPDGTFATVASSDSLAERADRIQAEEGEGPALTATEATGLGLAQACDLRSESLWPGYARRMVDELGIHSVLATGMFPGGPPRFGALTFHARDPEALAQTDREHALVLAAHAATAIAAVQARTAGELREAQLTEALQSRDVIGQAKGILMQRRGYSADEAFDALRRTSQDLNVKLRDVAATLVDRRAEL